MKRLLIILFIPYILLGELKKSPCPAELFTTMSKAEVQKLLDENKLILFSDYYASPKEDIWDIDGLIGVGYNKKNDNFTVGIINVLDFTRGHFDSKVINDIEYQTIGFITGQGQEGDSVAGIYLKNIHIDLLDGEDVYVFFPPKRIYQANKNTCYTGLIL